MVCWQAGKLRKLVILQEMMLLLWRSAGLPLGWCAYLWRMKVP